MPGLCLDQADCPDHVWTLSESLPDCLNPVWTLSCACLEGLLPLSELCLEHPMDPVWTVTGPCLNPFQTVLTLFGLHLFTLYRPGPDRLDPIWT